MAHSFRSRSYGKLHPPIPPPPPSTSRTKPCLIISASAIILVAATIFLSVGFIHFRNSHSSSADSPSSIAAQSFCHDTLYPDTCIKDLSSDLASSKSANPRQLVVLGIKAALHHAQKFSEFASAFRQQSKGLERVATEDCLELFDDAMDQLNASIFQLSNLKLSSLSQQLEDVKVWLSSSFSYQTACSDGFYSKSENVTSLMLVHQEEVSRSLANSLSLVDILSQLQKDVSESLPPIPFRRLLVDVEDTSMHDFPHWLSASDRKLLQVSNAPSPPNNAPSENGTAPINNAPPPVSYTPSNVTAPVNNVTSPASNTTTPSVNVNTPNLVVAKDGSGSFTTIQDAVNAIPHTNTDRYVIYIKKGIYDEIVTITKKQINVMFVGDGIGNTIITGNRNVAGSDYTTFRSATVAITGQGFMAKGITFQNTAGPSGHQAVALRISADHAVLESCSFEGYQDTLYAISGRQFYRDCLISGTVDYIFGNAISVFQNCRLIARQPLPSQKNTYTAQGRKVQNDPSGFSFQGCTFTGEAGLQASVQNFLGRPWKPYSRTVILKSQLEGLVDPAGWLPWDPTNAFGETVYYGEYGNTGAGSSIAKRVTWAGVHSSMSLIEAQQFSVSSFISGSTWLPAANVVFDATVPQ